MVKKSKQDGQALLVVDVQQGLFDRETPIYKAEEVLANINRLIDNARQANVPVIFIQHSNEQSLAMDSAAWQLHPGIKPLPGEVIVHKLKGNAFAGTNLQEELRKRDVGQVFICGLVTHGCVKATCLGSIKKDYRTMLVGDAHSNFSKEAARLIDYWNGELRKAGAELVWSKEINFAG